MTDDIVKKAGVNSDYLMGIGGNMLWNYGINALVPDSRWRRAIAQAPDTIGVIHGLATNTPTLKEFKELDEKAAKGFIPGVSESRLIRRRRLLRNLLKKNKHSYDYPLSERYGALFNLPASMFSGAALGAGIGKLLQKDPYTSAGLGAVTGVAASGIGTIGGMLLAGLKKRRTLEEQEKYENTPFRALKSIFIPGYSAYNHYKSLGAAKNLSEMSVEEIEKEVERIRKLRGYEI